jgi:hypothetical protein
MRLRLRYESFRGRGVSLVVSDRFCFLIEANLKQFCGIGTISKSEQPVFTCAQETITKP